MRPEIRRVLKTGGEALVQLPNVFGVHCLYQVRHWTIPKLKATFWRFIGPAMVLVDGYFYLNSQVSDVELLPRRYRAIVHTSDLLQRLGVYMPALSYISDSLYVSALRLDGVSPTP